MRKRTTIFILLILVFMSLAFVAAGAAAETAACNIDNDWTGASDTNWTNTANWSCGVVPTTTTNVTIPGGLTNYPVVPSATAVNVTNLTVDAGASFDLNGNTLAVSSTLTNNGTLIDRREVSNSNSGGTNFFYTGGYRGMQLGKNGGQGLANPGVITVAISLCNAGSNGVPRCYDITPSVIANVSLDAKFDFPAADLPGGATCSNLQAYHWNGTSWSAAGTPGTNICSGDNFTVVTNNIVSFSVFQVAEGTPTAVSFVAGSANTAGDWLIASAITFVTLAFLSLALILLRRKRIAI